MKTLRLAIGAEKGGPWYELYREDCPVCGKQGFCMIHEDKNRVVCTRVPSDYTWGKNNHGLHFLNKKKIKRNFDFSKVEDVQTVDKKTDQQLDEIFRGMMDCLDLNDNHYKHLTGGDRQLKDDQITIRGYKSFPYEKPWNFVKEWADSLNMNVEDLIGTPSIYRYKNKYQSFITMKGLPSIMIPFRNHKNQIVGFQLRVDQVNNVAKVKNALDGIKVDIAKQPNIVSVTYKSKEIFKGEFPIGSYQKVILKGKTLCEIKVSKGTRYFWLSSANEEEGTGAGTPLPVHVSVPTRRLKKWKSGETLKAKTVWISEGPLKIDIASDKAEELYDPMELDDIGTTFLGIPGVNQWHLILPILEEMEVDTVNLAFDADAASNPDVYHYLKECAIELKKRGYRGNLVRWNEEDGKGLDDLFNHYTLPQIDKLF
ncbi:DUF3854 domain-containing protein [Desertibacillus haloalkaliphilus]|uniref:DUF3854 domain-containing protein n=1 Tax=Desertibacillus haloalkaliphilus TaxID=1328930 RepID=UPI001C2695F1|nr:DUF3854 domain-containing protein [Desertibacillus haloalkaliphilus]MBU8908088.1 DUF3854 domain-containing protein [Desertibacillus haloalkaliphilus]